MRPTVGQYFPRRVSPVSTPAGKAASCREYGRDHSVSRTSDAVCGAWRSADSSIFTLPASISSISSAIVSIAAIKRSISAISSLSVGSIIKVPATGKLIVGAWNPKSIKRLAMSSTLTPVRFVISRRSIMHSCAIRPF